MPRTHNASRPTARQRSLRNAHLQAAHSLKSSLGGGGPVIGHWYCNREDGSMFEVVAIDEQHQTIEAQLVDGAICEYDYENWLELDLKRVDGPEDWTSPFEISKEDLSGLDEPESIWATNPLDDFESDTIYGIYED